MAGRIRAGLWRRMAHPWPSARVAATRAPVLVATLVFVLALAPRLAWVVSPGVAGVWNDIYEHRQESTEAPRDDMSYYILTARSLAQGDGYVDPATGAPTARAPLGWPAVLSVFYVLFGPNVLSAQIFNAFVASATCAVTYLLGARLFDTRVGLGAGLILALFPVHILWSAVLLTEVTFTFALAVILLFASGNVLGWRAFVLGLMVGAATLIRTEALLLPILIIALLLARGLSWRETSRLVVFVVCGMAVFVVPWAARNTLAFDAPVFLTTRTGVTLFVGRGAGDLNHYYELAYEYRNLPEPKRSLEIDRAAMGEAVDDFMSNPLADLGWTPAKLRRFYLHDPVWTAYGHLLIEPSWSGPPSFGKLRAIAEAYNWFVLAGALLAVALHPSSSSRFGYTLLFGTVGLWSFMFGVLFFGDARYHLALLPVLSILAASGYTALLEQAGHATKLTGPSREPRR
jgi:4-amino-4-deoxy-L-arabinose transferase-like glycosyltransferase